MQHTLSVSHSFPLSLSRTHTNTGGELKDTTQTVTQLGVCTGESVTFENGVPLAPDEFSLRVLDLRMRDISVEEGGAAGVSVVVSVKDSVAALYDGVADKKGLARGAFRLRTVVGGGGGGGGGWRRTREIGGAVGGCCGGPTGGAGAAL